ncbi:MAG: FAD-binding oxidoreductase [Actinomycetia bacterium]|nr:FAD-binding oxidoreductase [Actinomycetes bacterium]
MINYPAESLWFDTLPESIVARPALAKPTHVDVAIVGAGYTGLWTAYYLQERDPSLRIALVEAEIAGFGASGRNGGWLSALYPVHIARLAAEHGREAAIAQYRAMEESVAEVARVAAAEGIDADIALGGTISLVRSQAQLARARAEVAEHTEYGLDLELLDADAARARLAATDVIGATYTPHCGAVHPAKLVRGLARLVEQRGAVIYEQTRANAIGPGSVDTEHGRLSAGVVIRATEGFTAQIPRLRRVTVPVYSLIVATAPLPASVWDEIGLAQRETWSDHRNLIIYGQRTADDRMVFGGRGAPYHYGSRIHPSYDQVPKVFTALTRTLRELFPVLRSAPITHRWGGPIGIARDWHASVGLDQTTGLGWAGGYVGDGVSTTNLAGRTLADLITHRQTPLTQLPWVGHQSRNWEPEPLRWLGANAGLWAMNWADAAEHRTGRPSHLAALVDRVLGR